MEMSVGQSVIVLTGLFFCADLTALTPKPPVEPNYFEGRWAFTEEACDALSNWTLIAGGIFVSEDLTGNWEWQDGRLILSLTDLAIDEETGEIGGRFQMDGPVEILNPDSFKLTIAPDVYEMKKCSESSQD